MVDQPFRVRKGIVVANTTASANLDPVTLTIGTSIVNATHHAAGVDIILSTSDVKIGTGTSNVYANTSILRVVNPSNSANLQPSQLTIGTSVVNSSAVQADSISTANISLSGNLTSVNLTATNLTVSGFLKANGTIGSAGQLLTSDAAKAYWSTPAAAVVYATDADVRAAAAGNLAIKASELESSSADVTLTDAATIALDWDTGINFTVTLTASRILGNPTNGQPGTWRSILVTQPVGGAAILTFGNQYKFPGGSVPIIGAGASAQSRLLIYCRTSTVFECYMAGASLA